MRDALGLAELGDARVDALERVETTFAEALQQRPHHHGELRLVLAPGTSLRLRELPPPTGPVTLLIGPEGGLDEGEMQAAAAAGFTSVGLGPRVLRTETAGPAVLAALMALWGDG